MLINLKVKTLDAQTHEFSIDNEITVREFKDLIAEKTNIAADQQRIIYCGRVLVDDKHLKDYDVDGKVLHVAERPPPSQGGASSSSTTNSYPNDEMPRGRPTLMRNSPLFRALDGMVVGTMAIPMNAGPNNGQVPLNASSSFCINRITVARHMLECANNIAAYLEDPERGLNNRPLDILSRGRWTMESTVVELAITAADLPQSQNIAEMVQGAVTAALRGNNNANVTVLQMPTMLAAHPPDVVADIEAVTGGDHGSDGEGPTTAAVIIEDVTETEEDGSVSASSLAAQASSSTSSNGSSSTSATAQSAADGGEQGGNATSTGTNTDENGGASRRTSTRVLAEVVEEMRNVQNRLNPFIQQFYDLLQNEPNFESGDTNAIENSQRLYDRVSEALHYMSHAQHAISDLMLDVSQPAPRYLTCRPIMVEQSGYVSSNNYLANAAAAAASASVAAAAMRQQQQAQAQQQTGNNNNSDSRRNSPFISLSNPPGTTGGTSSARNTTTTTTNNNNSTTGTGSNASSAAGIVEDPVDEPMVAPPPIPVPPASANAANVGTQSNDNHQMRMARIIQAVVNSTPINSDFDVQINAPIGTFGIPINPATAAALVRQQQQQQQQQQQSSSTSEATTTATPRQSTEAGNANATTSATTTASASASATTSTTNNSTLPTTATTMTANQARVNTITLPTTSTQTRSTSRPQVQIGNIHTGGWNGSFANVMSSFDRFLPCNSHHIPDTTNGNNNNNAGNNNTADAAATTTPTPPNSNGTQNSNNNNNNNNTARVGSTLMSPLRNRHLRSSNMMLHNLLNFSPTMAARDAAAPTISVDLGLTLDANHSNLRSQFQDFLNEKIFEGAPINAETIPRAVSRVVHWFGESLLYLPQYEKPGYDSRDSVSKILQGGLPPLFEMFNESNETAARFENRLKQIFEQFVKRLYSVIFVCVGRDNAEMYWAQLMRQLLVPVRSNFRAESLQFLCVYINPNVPNSTDVVDAEQFIVRRKLTAQESEVCPPMETDEAPTCVPEVSLDIDDIELNNAFELDNAADVLPILPIIGSEPWHRNFPNDWLPIITRDIQTQSETPPTQAPYSDAYISGMSAKRRKLIQSTKPPSDVRSLVGESVRRAIQNVGVSNSTASNQSQTADEIISAIANDSAVQASYTEAVRSNVRERTKQEPDYKPDKFPHITNFINNK